MQTVHLQPVLVSSLCLKCILLPREDGLINKILHGYIRHGNKGITDTRVKFFKCTLFQNDFRADPIAQVNSSLESTDSKNVTQCLFVFSKFQLVLTSITTLDLTMLSVTPTKVQQNHQLSNKTPFENNCKFHSFAELNHAFNLTLLSTLMEPAG